ncbi:hypothetical protein NV379_22345 [Paenibacillus sp. N1-5-1-14]|uniref:hypothetical protein n=1 Tax=Paenibacillus radicibacter TaxID=2972488 RepID=UPI0021595653|nr:hypothetical protein [Paenibacillus radicibacter]MCR8645381.1 hypothetical protein [Paenibacillus radicibacter]
MKKIVMGFICGTIFFTGISAYAMNITTETEAIGYQVDFDNGNIKLNSNRTDAKKEDSTSSDQNVKLQRIPVTQKINEVEVIVHAIRITDKTTDFEITIKNNTDDENITPDLLSSVVGANDHVVGKPYETVKISPTNPDFGTVNIKPNKEIHGWVRHQGLVEKNIENLTFQLTLNGKSEKRTFTFHIDCKDMKFRTL